MNSGLQRLRAVLRRQRLLLGSMLGLGITGLLGSAGTYALFTASSGNPGNSFTSGTLVLTDTTTFVSAASSLSRGLPGTPANLTATDPRAGLDCATAAVAAVCQSLMKSVNVAANGLEPGQFLRTTVTVTNAGSLPATVAMQVQNVRTNNGDATLHGGAGATGTQPCASDINGVAGAVTGAHLPANATAAGYQGAAVPITGCRDLGTALRVTVQDSGTGITGPQCLFGNDTGGTPGVGANANDRLQAPVQGGLSTGGAGLLTYVATGTPLGSGSGACDDLSQASALGAPTSPVLPGSNPKDLFGVQGGTSGNSSLAALSGTASLLFVPGGGTSRSLINQAALGGNLRNLPQWKAGERHDFTVTLALPDTGATVLTDARGQKYSFGNDNPFEGGAASFDLYWFAIQ